MTGVRAGVRAEWDAEAATYDEAADHGLRAPRVREAWRRLLTGVLPDAPARVVDLGCGTGSVARVLVDEGHRVTALDLSGAMLARAAAKVPEAAIVRGDAADPPLARGSFDVVFARHVLWAVPDPTATVPAWVDLLAPGGRLVLVEGRWHTGAGLPAAETVRAVRRVRDEARVRRLDDPDLWGGPIADERYLVLSRS